MHHFVYAQKTNVKGKLIIAGGEIFHKNFLNKSMKIAIAQKKS
tara:strand:- start:1198 stop:1326 length:129 start_codon:yes stop_codon:yes gene_type:complete